MSSRGVVSGAWARRAAAAARAAACALWLCGPALASGPGGTAPAPALREKDVRRAERVLEKLRLLEAAGAGRTGAAEFRSLAREFYPGLSASVAELRPSDLKTDLDTAAFLYEEAGRAWGAAGEAAADCAGERPDTYRPLCLGLRGGSVRELLLLKARLHARWAEAAVRAHRGGVDAGAARALSEMRAARAGDWLIAARVVEELKSLAGSVEVPRSYADYQERGAPARVGPAGLEGEFSEGLARAGGLLGWMARGETFYALRGAWQSYTDGLFWYRRARAAGRLVVSVEGFEAGASQDPGRDPEQAGHAVFVNWRAAARYTRLAEQAISTARAATDARRAPPD